MLWRPDMESKEILRIDQGSKSAYADISAGANFRKWPTDTLALQFGVDYRLSGAGLSAPITVRFTEMGAIPDTVEGSVDMLMAKGCTAQINRLAESMSEAETSGG